MYTHPSFEPTLCSLQVQVSSLSGVPEEQLKRVARISMPTRNAMQSGTHNINHWQLDFDTQERWENPLMGWASRYVHETGPMSALIIMLCCVHFTVEIHFPICR